MRRWCGLSRKNQASELRGRAEGRISIFEKLRAQATSSKSQTPSSKESPSSKLKNRPARRLPRHLFLWFGVLRFGTSLELGVCCLVFRSAVDQELRCPLSAPLLGGLGVGSGSQCAPSKSRALSKSGIPLTRSGASRFSQPDF